MTGAPNIAVLGCGMIVRRAHLPGLIAGGARVPVLFGPDNDNSRALQRDFAIPRLVHRLEEVFATRALNGAAIALPNFQHAPAALAAIAARLPLLLEKPIAATFEDAKTIVERAGAAGVPISMSLPQRFRPSVQRIREIVQSGALGRIQTIDIVMTRRAGIPGYGGWFTRRDLAGGGVMMDLGPHVLDLALWLADCSSPSEVVCRTWRAHGPRGVGIGDWGRRRTADPAEATFDVEDRAWLSFDLANDVRATCEVAWAHYGEDDNRIRIVGDRGGVDYRPQGAGPGSPLQVFFDAPRPREPMPPDHDDLYPAWAAVARAFVEDVAAGSHRRVGGAQALAVAALIDCAYRAAAD